MGRGEFRSVSLPARLVEDIEKVVGRVGYWTSKTDFVREAVIYKLERYRRDEKK